MLTIDEGSAAGLNFDALVRPVRREAGPEMTLREWGARYGAAWVSLFFRLTVVVLLLGGSVAVILLVVSAYFENAAAGHPQLGFPIVGGLLLLVGVFLALAVYIIRVALRVDAPGLGRRVGRMRLDAFVEDNPPMTLTRRASAATYPGLPFQSTIRPVLFDVVRTQFQLPLEIGNLRHMGIVGNAQARIVSGYMRIPLGRALPNMLLVSKKDRDNTAIPVEVRGDQTMSLEGDFDRYFTLYVPREYERDALYVFTPDLMALLIDEANQFDVEIVDSWLQIYSHQPFSMTDPATYVRASRLVELLGAKATRQTARYSDDRSPLPSTAGRTGPGEVATQGRRLRTAPQVTIFLVALAAAGGVVISFFLR